ncbi:variable large family protein, partial [Borreliella garinii]|uniref:variable large family protein n=1 Tax=Borreliella garinii TaxID=29519 RepID=UPI001F33D9AE
MKTKNDKIAAAIVLRGMARDGKFALGAGDFNNHKSGVKSTVENAVAVGNVFEADAGNGGSIADGESVKGIASGMKAIVEVAKKVDGVKFEPEAAVEAADDGNKNAGKLFASQGNGGGAADAGKAAAAVIAVSGDQILKAIVDAASAGGDGGANAQNAANPIAAAIVLRGMAKDGKFALGNGAFAAHKSGVKSTVENA